MDIVWNYRVLNTFLFTIIGDSSKSVTRSTEMLEFRRESIVSPVGAGRRLLWIELEAKLIRIRILSSLLYSCLSSVVITSVDRSWIEYQGDEWINSFVKFWLKLCKAVRMNEYTFCKNLKAWETIYPFTNGFTIQSFSWEDSRESVTIKRNRFEEVICIVESPSK